MNLSLYPYFGAILRRLCRCAPGLLLTVALATAAAAAPAVGTKAPDFTLRTLTGEAVTLSALTVNSPVVLVVLRGWPQYQCPVCTRQVQDYIAQAAAFAAKGARVLMIYPGPAEQLQAHAAEFLENKQWPAEFLFVTDPDYAFTRQYGLRWDAPKETAYPSTFVFERGGKIAFAQVSTTHGGRVGAAQALAALKP